MAKEQLSDILSALMEQEKKNVLYAVLRMVQEDEAYDKVQMDRLCYNVRMLAEAMQLSPKYSDVISDKYIETLELAAPLCILENATILSDIIKVGGYNEFIQMALEIIESHHENWDGREVPLSAQIVTMVRAYCSLIGQQDAVFAMLEKEVGVKYNPDMFAILKKIYRQLK